MPKHGSSAVAQRLCLTRENQSAQLLRLFHQRPAHREDPFLSQSKLLHHPAGFPVTQGTVPAFRKRRFAKKSKCKEVAGQPDIVVSPVAEPGGNKEKMVTRNLQLDSILQLVPRSSAKKHEDLPEIMGMPCHPAGEEIRCRGDIGELGESEIGASQFGFPDFKHFAFGSGTRDTGRHVRLSFCVRHKDERQSIKQCTPATGILFRIVLAPPLHPQLHPVQRLASTRVIPPPLSRPILLS